jgi:hypothetical protein
MAAIGKERELRPHWQRVRELMLQEADVAALSSRVLLAVLKDAKLDVTALSEPIERMMDLLSNGKLNVVEEDEPPTEPTDSNERSETESNERSDIDSKEERRPLQQAEAQRAADEERRRQEAENKPFWHRFLAARPVVSIAVDSKSHRYLRCENVTKCDIMIKRIRTIPKTIFVAGDHSLIAFTDGLLGVPFTALIPPDETWRPARRQCSALAIHDHCQLAQHPLDMAAPMAGFHLVVYAEPACSRQGIKYAERSEVGGGRGCLVDEDFTWKDAPGTAPYWWHEGAAWQIPGAAASGG